MDVTYHLNWKEVSITDTLRDRWRLKYKFLRARFSNLTIGSNHSGALSQLTVQDYLLGRPQFVLDSELGKWIIRFRACKLITLPLDGFSASSNLAAPPHQSTKVTCRTSRVDTLIRTIRNLQNSSHAAILSLCSNNVSQSISQAVKSFVHSNFVPAEFSVQDSTHSVSILIRESRDAR